MATLEELSYSVLSNLAGTGRVSSDINLPIELVEFSIINNRAMLIRQDQTKGHSLSDNILQTLPCVPVQNVDRSLCPCTVPSNCTIKRTVNQLPKFLELHQKDMLMKVSGVNVMSKSWSVIPYSRAVWAGQSSITKDSVKVFLHNRYIYILNSPNVQYISVQGVFEDPRELENFSTCSGTPCYDSTQEFPVSAFMIPVLKELVIKDLILIRQIPEDNLNNEQDDKGSSRVPQQNRQE